MFAHANTDKLYQPLPKYPASTRDIAVLCDDSIPVAHMEKAIAKAVGGILEAVSLFDVYKGDQVPVGLPLSQGGARAVRCRYVPEHARLSRPRRPSRPAGADDR